ncbi:MAG: DUF6512 family protein [Clostridia bacterium]|nr:DUF6512 family protein [Clostridia bacterium]
MEKKNILKYSIIGFFVISIIGTLLHFTYDFFGRNILIAPFSSVNESVWEHVKIAVMPVFLWTILEFCEMMYRPRNLWTSLLVKILTIMLIIITAYYTYTYIIGKHVLWVDISIFYIAILVSQLLGYKVATSGDVDKNREEIYQYITIFLFILFILFTFLPPRFELFKDETTDTYGVFELK